MPRGHAYSGRYNRESHYLQDHVSIGLAQSSGANAVTGMCEIILGYGTRQPVQYVNVCTCLTILPAPGTCALGGDSLELAVPLAASQTPGISQEEHLRISCMPRTNLNKRTGHVRQTVNMPLEYDCSCTKD